MKVDIDFDVSTECVTVKFTPQNAGDRVNTGALYAAKKINDECIEEDGTYMIWFGFPKGGNK